MKSSVKPPNTDCLQETTRRDYHWEDWDYTGIITGKTGIIQGLSLGRLGLHGIITGKTGIMTRKIRITLGISFIKVE